MNPTEPMAVIAGSQSSCSTALPSSATGSPFPHVLLLSESADPNERRSNPTPAEGMVTDVPRPKGVIMTRLRSVWSVVAVAAMAGMLAVAGHAKADDTVKVGILHSLSGTMAISETSLRDVELMAIEEINDAGGVLGKKVVPVVVDPASNWDLFAEKAKELITVDKVVATFGCWTSVSRKSVLPVFEEYNQLLFY
ncbi:MAG TPA: transporter substrate-binding protein, partial [Pirellulales bacterium]|nr:transporter substrate-binding protein [Pirellulales bacterium]